MHPGQHTEGVVVRDAKSFARLHQRLPVDDARRHLEQARTREDGGLKHSYVKVGVGTFRPKAQLGPHSSVAQASRDVAPPGHNRQAVVVALEETPANAMQIVITR